MRSSRLRITVQIGFLLFMTWIGYRHQILGGGPQGVPPVDALCPFGGIESLYAYLTTGGWLRRVAPSALLLMVGVTVMTLITGRTFCGWICPLGTIGELSAKAARRLGIRARELPYAIDSKLRYLKYVILFLIIVFTWKMGTLVWRDLDPWVAYMHISAGWSEFVEKPWSFVVLFGTVIFASLYIERFWCRYLCPLGALLAPLQKLSLIKVRRSEDHCINCHICSRECPVRLDPEAVEKVESGECISCGRCVEGCPREKALFFGTGSRSFKTITVGIAGLFIFFGVYGISKATGIWQTWATPTKLQMETSPVDSVYGWMTIEQVAETLGLSVEEVMEGGNIASDAPLDVPMKEIEGVNDEEVKEALEVYLEEHDISVEEPGISMETKLSPDEIRGSSTMQEISQSYGLDGSNVFEEAGWPSDLPVDKPLKDIASELDKEVQEIRDAVKELLKQ